MSGIRGVAAAHDAWSADLNRAVTQAIQQVFAERPDDPIAHIGRFLTSKAEGPSLPSTDPSLAPAPRRPQHSAAATRTATRGSHETYMVMWQERVESTVTRALTQTLVQRPPEPLAHLGRLLLDESTGAATAIETANVRFRAQLSRQAEQIKQLTGQLAAKNQLPVGDLRNATVTELTELSAPDTEGPGSHHQLSLPNEESAKEDQEDASGDRYACVMSVASEYKQLLSVRGSPLITPVLSILLTLPPRSRRRSMIDLSGCS